MSTFDDEIGRRIAEALESGELARAKGYGKPDAPDAAWEATPAALRMPMKILKDAGVPPAEVALFHERARLRAAVAGACAGDEQARLSRELAELEQKIALRLEALGLESRA